jgi:hypothetical protein
VDPRPHGSVTQRRGGTDRAVLADGELAGGEVTTIVITVPRRSRWCKWRDRRRSGIGSSSPMVERQSCSPAVSRLRPSQGAGKSSRAPVRWCDAVALEKEERVGAEG